MACEPEGLCVMSLIAGCSEVKSEGEFYECADKYWKTIPATVNGMLGGYSRISATDSNGSLMFLKGFIQDPAKPVKTKRALDCGAGIGRVSKNLLLPIFDCVDLLEQNGDFLSQAPSYIGPKLAPKVGKYISCGMQNAVLNNSYDLIWIQWVTGHLTDVHLVEFLKKCAKALAENGIVVIKDNVASADVEWDATDSSVTRNYRQMGDIFERAGLSVVKEKIQKDFPAELYKIYMFALRESL